mmetsp:Transcript_36935/g.95752  ORF Transcript_36935/g.95752 Transcript_36935/m.95752 type:complete len:384 (-) Transcript_36935:403-1554(-)
MSMTQVPPEVKDISVSSMESTTVPVQHAIVSETQLPTSPVSGALPPRTADSSAKVEGSGLKARRTEMSSMPLSRKGEEDVEAGGRSNHRRKISEDLSLHKGDQEERLDNRSAVSSAHARSWLGRQADSMSILFSELATMMRYWNDDTSLRGYAAQLAFASIGIVAGVVGWTFYGSLLLLTAALDSCCHASQVFVYLYSAFLCAKRRDPLFTYGMERAEVVLTFASSVSIGFMSFFAMFDGLSALMSGEVGEASAVPFLALATFAVNTFSTLFLRSIPPRAFISSAGVKGKSSGALGAGDGISPLRALYEFSGSEALVKRLKELNREAFTFAAFNIALNLAVLLISVVEEFQVRPTYLSKQLHTLYVHLIPLLTARELKRHRLN